MAVILVKQYAEQGGNTVYGTTRSSESPEDFPTDIIWLSGIDLVQPNVGETLVSHLGSSQTIDLLIITVSYFATEDLTMDKGLSWEREQRMYTTSSIAPVFIVHQYC
ncbi:hypothetical protein NW768_001614 [Fusarium equiseti]|uniref:Uncharacterized protein n=1 Tax=Fusarium equiseti TaxID=61235 RepID=A0ABQ8RR29_FUSEQ|nr:hypothetical protein NW768_001614 [Fusarium equiseti]